MHEWRAAAIVGAAVLVVAPAAMAAPPPNDNRANATPIGASASVSGSTAGATTEASDPSTFCGRTDGTLWYFG